MGNTPNPRAIPSSCRNRPCAGPQRWQMMDIWSQQYLSFLLLYFWFRPPGVILRGKSGHAYDSFHEYFWLKPILNIAFWIHAPNVLLNWIGSGEMRNHSTESHNVFAWRNGFSRLTFATEVLLLLNRNVTTKLCYKMCFCYKNGS